MQLLFRNISIGQWKIPVAVFIWFFLTILTAVVEISRGPSAINNYSIYKGVFEHIRVQTNLYIPYPAEYFDTNHYGPFFSIIIGFFALFPDFIGCFLWCIATAAILFIAVQQLSFSRQHKNMILLIGLVEMLTAIHSVQFNTMLTGWMILSFVLVEKENDFWAAFFIVAGFLTKVYGIAGIAFFCFSKHKIKFIGFLIFWFVILFCLPMILSSASFVLQSYKDWYVSIIEKNAQNTNTSSPSIMQDISVMGMIRRIFKISTLNDLWILVPAAILTGLPLLRFKQYKSVTFRLTYLCLLLVGVVIFSSSAESPTFVIAVTGIAIWYVTGIEMNQKIKNILLVFVIVLTSLSATDLFPVYVRQNIIFPYSLKALPCFIIWLVMVCYLLLSNFNLYKTYSNE